MSEIEIPAPTEWFGVFCGEINQHTAGRAADFLAKAQSGQATKVHLLLQSQGGSVQDGVFLYSLLKSLQLDVSVYNGALVASAAATFFLGAPRRVVSPRGVFVVHKTSNAVGGTATRLEKNLETLAIDDKRTEEILRETCEIPDEAWQEMKYHDVWVTPEKAIKWKLATEIGHFAIPKGQPLHNVV